jgi:group I intron endonuclease
VNNDTGIYSITSPSGKQYIGSAVSFKRRWIEHRKELRGRRHHSSALQNAWDKHGEENMIFAKIALCPVTDLLMIEQRFIDALRPEYNISQVAGSPMLGMRHRPETLVKISLATAGAAHPLFGKSPTVETRAKIGLGRLGKFHSAATLANMSASRRGINNVRAQPVICIETNQLFSTMNDAVTFLRQSGKERASPSGVSAACLGRYKSAYGYHWRYADQPIEIREK